MLGVARYRHCRLSPSSSSALAARGGVVLVVQGVTIAVSALPTPCAAEATRGLGTVYELRIQEPPSRRHTGVLSQTGSCVMSSTWDTECRMLSQTHSRNLRAYSNKAPSVSLAQLNETTERTFICPLSGILVHQEKNYLAFMLFLL